MATRTRSRAKTAAKAPDPKPVASAATADDEQVLGADDSEERDSGPAGISLSHEDFEGNPRVLDMAAIVDGKGADDGADADGDDEDDDEPEPAPAPKRNRAKATAKPAAAPARGGRVRVQLVGMASNPKARAPYGFTTIFPSGLEEGEDPYAGPFTEGQTIHFIRGRSVSVSAAAAAWLEGHPELIVERA